MPGAGPAFCTAAGGTKRGCLLGANAQRRQRHSRGVLACHGAGPAFCTAAGGTKRGRLFWAYAQKRRRSRPISRVLSWTVIRLGATSPQRSSNLPGSSAGHANGSLFGLAPGGVCRAGPLPDSRCALTAPFHPYHAPLARPFGGISLLHFPSACAAQALPGTLPYGARTFLGTLASDATVWPTPPGRILRYRHRPERRSVSNVPLTVGAHPGASSVTDNASSPITVRSRRPPYPPYNALRGAPVSSAASLAAVEGGRCSASLA